MTDVCWSELRGRPQFVVESVHDHTGRGRLFHFGGIVLEDMDVAT